MNWILIILGLNIIAIAVIYILLRRRIDRAVRSTELLSQIELEIDKIVTELNLTADRNVTLMEDRIRTMNNLLELADKKLILLSRATERKRGDEPVVYSRPRMPVLQDSGIPQVEGSYQTAGASSEPHENVSSPVPEPPNPREMAVPAENVSFSPSTGRQEDAPVKVDFSASRPVFNPEPPKTSKQLVLEMSAAGIDANVIASKLNITLGEIELILSMNQRSAPER